MYTKRLLLREFTLEDDQAVLEYGSDEMTLKYLIWEGITDIEGARRSITNYYIKPGIFALALKENNRQEIKKLFSMIREEDLTEKLKTAQSVKDIKKMFS